MRKEIDSQRGGFSIDGGTPFNPPQAQTMPSHYDHPARIMAAEAQIASLKAALREALDQWESWNRSELEGPSGWLCDGGKHAKRITELRKQFLED